MRLAMPHRTPFHAVRAVLVAAALAVAAAPATAFDLTGTYAGKYVCKGFFGAKFSFTSQPDLAITQSGDAIGVMWSFGGYLYSGVAIADNKKPDNKGEAALVLCGTNDALVDGNYNELGRFKVATKASTNPSKPAKGKLTGVSIYTEANSNEVYTCKWSFKRVDDANPGILTACP
jgi:hypothetical protein